MNENTHPHHPAAPDTHAQNFSPLVQSWINEGREHHVIVLPDDVDTDPLDPRWLHQHNPFDCRIIQLGLTMDHERFDGISEIAYCGLISEMIAAGFKVINKKSLAETNAKYLENYPGGEGVNLSQP
jgi:hypothetical protein